MREERGEIMGFELESERWASICEKRRALRRAAKKGRADARELQWLETADAIAKRSHWPEPGWRAELSRCARSPLAWAAALLSSALAYASTKMSLPNVVGVWISWVCFVTFAWTSNKQNERGGIAARVAHAELIEKTEAFLRAAAGHGPFGDPPTTKELIARLDRLEEAAQIKEAVQRVEPEGDPPRRPKARRL
jgi:hypothetical protein